VTMTMTTMMGDDNDDNDDNDNEVTLCNKRQKIRLFLN
jgi:hypothetical protein